jgi:hypothetical protein
MYNGPTKDGKPDNKDKKADNWCKNNAPAQISAAKISRYLGSRKIHLNISTK